MKVRIFRNPKLTEPRMIAGLPGMGLVAKQTVDYFIEQTKAEVFGDVQVPYFLPNMAIFNKGVLIPIKSDHTPFKFYFSKEHNLIIFRGDTQFGNPINDHNLADKITDMAKDIGVKRIYLALSNVVTQYSEEPKVYGIATTPELLEELRSSGVEIAEEGTRVNGTNGLILDYAFHKEIEGAGILCDTAFPEILDLKASLAGVKKISELLDIKLDLSKMEEETGKFEESYRYYQDSQKKDEPDLDYIG